MDLLQKIVARAKSNKQRIVLPEATEERTLRAADRVLAEDIADIILIGNPEEIKGLAAEWGLNSIDKATIIDPENNPKSEEYAQLLAELRAGEGKSVSKEESDIKDVVLSDSCYTICSPPLSYKFKVAYPLGV